MSVARYATFLMPASETRQDLPVYAATLLLDLIPLITKADQKHQDLPVPFQIWYYSQYFGQATEVTTMTKEDNRGCN